MRFTSRMLALAALLACAACADQSATRANLAGDAAQQFSAIRWDDAVSASQSAVVSNGKLIFMR